jgi:hypothetical protein
MTASELTLARFLELSGSGQGQSCQPFVRCSIISKWEEREVEDENALCCGLSDLGIIYHCLVITSILTFSSVNIIYIAASLVWAQSSMLPVSAQLPRNGRDADVVSVTASETPDPVLDLLLPLISSSEAGPPRWTALQVREVREKLEKSVKDNKVRSVGENFIVWKLTWARLADMRCS